MCALSVYCTCLKMCTRLVNLDVLCRLILVEHHTLNFDSGVYLVGVGLNIDLTPYVKVKVVLSLDSYEMGWKVK